MNASHNVLLWLVFCLCCVSHCTYTQKALVVPTCSTTTNSSYCCTDLSKPFNTRVCVSTAFETTNTETLVFEAIVGGISHERYITNFEGIHKYGCWSNASMGICFSPTINTLTPTYANCNATITLWMNAHLQNITFSYEFGSRKQKEYLPAHAIDVVDNCTPNCPPAGGCRCDAEAVDCYCCGVGACVAASIRNWGAFVGVEQYLNHAWLAGTVQFPNPLVPAYAPACAASPYVSPLTVLCYTFNNVVVSGKIVTGDLVLTINGQETTIGTVVGINTGVGDEMSSHTSSYLV